MVREAKVCRFFDVRLPQLAQGYRTFAEVLLSTDAEQCEPPNRRLWFWSSATR